MGFWIFMLLCNLLIPFTMIGFGKHSNIVGTLGGILCGMQLVFLVGSIFPTEIALKRTFDEMVLVGHNRATWAQSFSPVWEVSS